MEVTKTQRIRFVEVAKDIYAAITPACGLDITDAGMMDNFSNAAFIDRGEGLVCDTFFDLPHAQELKEFCIQKSGHAPKYVVNTHGHWDHYWGNQAFAESTVLGHKDMVKDCAGDEKKVGAFRLFHGSKALQSTLNRGMTLAFRKNLPAGRRAKVVVRVGEKDFDLTGVTPQLPGVLFEEDTALDLAGTEVRLLHLGAVHSSSDTVVWIPSERVLFAGDIFADCSLPMSLEAGKRWLAVLDYILDDLQPAYIIPGHGEVYDRARAENQRDYFRALLSRFEANYTPTIRLEALTAKMDLDEYLVSRPRLGWVMAVKRMMAEERKK